MSHPVIGNGIVGEFYLEPTKESLLFDGSDIVQVPSSTSLDIRRTITMEVRFKIDAFQPGQVWMPLVYKGAGSGITRTYSLWVNANGSLYIDSSDATGQQSFSTAAGVVTFGQWTEVADN